MSRLKPYPKYKPSGVEWIGEIPEGWEIKRLRFLCKVNPSKSELGFVDPTLPVSFLPMESISESGELNLDSIKEYAEISKGYTYLTDGDVVFAKITPCFENGKAAVIEDLENCIGFGTTELHVLRPNNMIDRHFLYYMVSNYPFKKIGESYMYGAGGQKRVPDDFARNWIIALPSKRVQQSISTYLNHESSRIKTLITKKQQQIELLKEKRTALITHAVTKGLDPHAKMKPSGIEWIGDVPEGWGVKAIKHITSIPVTDGPHETPEFLTEGVPFISAEAIKEDKIDFNKKRGCISIEDHKRYSQKYVPNRGDIFMIKSGATTGNVACVEIDEEFNIWSPLAVIRPDKHKAITKFVFFFMKSRNFFEAIELSWSFGTQQNIGMNVIENIHLAIPPINEQVLISNYLGRETHKIDKLVDKVNQSISLLQEYRTALITAVVTGKVEVGE